MKLIYLGLFLLICNTSTASELNYRWLEQISREYSFGYFNDEKQEQWMQEQERYRQSYLSRTHQPSLTEVFEEYYSESRVLKELILNDGSKVSMHLLAGAQGHELRVNDEVILNRELINESKFNFIESSFNTFHVNPSQSYLVVPVIEYGSSTVSEMLLIEIGGEKPRLKTVLEGETWLQSLTWLNSQTVRWWPANAPWGFELEMDLTSGIIELVTEETHEDLGHGFENGRFVYYSSSTNTSPDEPEGIQEYFNGNPAKNEGQNNDIVRVNIEIRPYLSEQTASVEFKVESDPNDFVPPSMVAATNGLFVFSESFRNHQKLFFAPYHYTKMGVFEVGEVKTHEPPKSWAIQNLWTSKEFLMVEYMAGPSRSYRIFDGQGNLLTNLNSPMSGSLREFEALDNGSFKFEWSSQILPKYEMEYNLEDPWDSKALNQTLLTDTDGTEYVNEFEFIKSLDGTSIPVRIVHKKGLSISDKSPLYITAYGGHGLVASFRPRYDFGTHTFLVNNGVYAAPAVRGGGEYGYRWYEPVFGTLVRYHDTSESIKALHAKGFGSPATTAFEGWSSGGLLAGVMATQYPELFKLVIPGNGLHDMERKEILEDNGYFAWIKDYGDHASKKGVEFIKSYSPLLFAMQPKEFPTIYAIVGTQDRRVNPSHSYKLIAALNDHQKTDNPILLHRVENQGHWPTSAFYIGRDGLETEIDKWKVIFNELGMSAEVRPPIDPSFHVNDATDLTKF